MLKLLQDTSAAAWAKFVSIYPRLEKFACPSIEFNTRFSTTAGMCYHSKNRIEISRKLFDINRDEIINVVVPHEIAHQVDWYLNAKSGHGPSWKQIMVDYGLPPERCHKINQSDAAQAAELMELAGATALGYTVGMQVAFMHRDRARVEYEVRGIITKVNHKTIKMRENNTLADWTVYVSCKTLRRI